MLAGLNFPISEDLLLIISGVLASTIVPENTYKLFLGVFLGAYLSDWVAYWIGRSLGTQLWRFRWFARGVKRERFEKVERYYERYGAITLLVGRFIPFGVRNCLFMTAGMAKMGFLKFILADGVACLASNSALFWLAYLGGKNYHQLVSAVEMVNYILFGLFIVAIIGFVWYKLRKRARI
jgi:membrane protein DedA with SNARE-associated domain